MSAAAAHAKSFLSATDSSSVSISIQGVPTAQGAIVNFITAPANLPKTYGNHIYVWQTTAGIVPWGKTPDGDTAINTDSTTSTVPVNFAFEEKGYIIGYAVAATPNAVCSTIYLPAGQQENPAAWQYAHISIQTVYVGTNLVQVKYTGLESYQPAANKNWIGLFIGSQVPYAGEPLKKINVTQNAPSGGYATIDGVQLLIGVQYAIGYFLVDPATGRTSLAASTSFVVGQS
jgi:hypothetical protein